MKYSLKASSTGALEPRPHPKIDNPHQGELGPPKKRKVFHNFIHA